MTTTVELVRFKTAADKTGWLLESRVAMVADFQADRDGFLGSRLVKLDDDEWLDIIEWATPEDFHASRAKGPNLPGIKAFFESIDSLVSDELGTTENPKL